MQNPDKETLRRALQEELRRRDGMREEAEDSLYEFMKLMWPAVEPARPFTEGWILEAIALHLEAISYGGIKRLLINVPPGMAKSLTSNVFFPAWEWGPRNMPHLRYIAASYSQSLTLRDNVRFRQIIMSPLYRQMWGDRFGQSKDQFNLIKVANDHTGWKLATSVGGVGTGERADRFVADDPNSVKESESEKVTESTNQWWTEVVPTRLNDPADSAIICIQQRTKEDDVSGITIAKEMGYTHLVIPMEYNPKQHCVTVLGWGEDGNQITWEDPRAEEGELCFPERFPRNVVEKLKHDMGPFASAGQFQQSPEPRGGGIIKRDWWRIWPPDGAPEVEAKKISWPPVEYIIASLDTAYTKEKRNDFSAMQVWGVFRDTGRSLIGPRLITDGGKLIKIDDELRPKAILMYGWQKKLDLHGPPEPPELKIATGGCSLCGAGRYAQHADDCVEYKRLRQKLWGLVEWVIDTGRRFKIDKLLIESQARGIDVANEMTRLYAGEDWGTELVPARGDKEARLYSVQHLWSNGVIYAPMMYSSSEGWQHPPWCQSVVDEISIFPHGRHDDQVDGATLALMHLRQVGLLLRRDEADIEIEAENSYQKPLRPLYEV